MSGFFYYLPGVEADQFKTDGEIDKVWLTGVGLGHLYDVDIWGRDLVGSTVRANGPDGGSGICLYCRPVNPPRDERVTQFKPEKQTWRKGIGGDFWVGLVSEDPPTPECLARSEQFSGATIRDTSKRVWQIPVARLPDEPFGFLPTSFTFDDEGELIPQVRGDCERLWEIGGRFFELFQTGRIAEIDDSEAIGLVMEVLAMNYRIGKSEIRLLTEATGIVLDSDFMFAATSVVSGFFKLGSKKKEEDEEDEET